MSEPIVGGMNIAMKVPSHQYQETVAFYRDVIGLKPVDKPPHIGFYLGPNQLWIDEAPNHGHAAIWLEFFTKNFEGAADRLAKAGVKRVDTIEPLGEDFRGGWIVNPANVVHLVREPDAW